MRISAGMVGILLNSYTPRENPTVQTIDDMAASELLTEGTLRRAKAIGHKFRTGLGVSKEEQQPVTKQEITSRLRSGFPMREAFRGQEIARDIQSG